MATILELFSRKIIRGFDASSNEQLSNGKSPDPLSERSVAEFEKLGVAQQGVSAGMDSVISDLSRINTLAQQLLALKKDVLKNFEDHRKLAVANAIVEHERDYVQLRHDEMSQKNDVLIQESKELRCKFVEMTRRFDKLRSDFETLESKHHLLVISKRDIEDVLQQKLSALNASSEFVETLQAEVALFKSRTDAGAARIAELNENFTEIKERAAFLANRCESLETGLYDKAAEVASLRELHDLVQQERDTAVNYGRQKEQERAQNKAEAARVLQNAQQEKKARDNELDQVRSELDAARSSIRTHEEIAAEMRLQNEKLAADIRGLEDRAKSLEALSIRQEAQLARVSSKLDTTSTAKAEIEKSRAVITARLEAVAQALSEREAEARRLEAELDQATVKNEKQAMIAKDTVKSLQAKIFELEKELSARRNETALYTSQLDVIRRKEAAGTAP